MRQSDSKLRQKNEPAPRKIQISYLIHRKLTFYSMQSQGESKWISTQGSLFFNAS
jgi:hypothetical protein